MDTMISLPWLTNCGKFADVLWLCGRSSVREVKQIALPTAQLRSILMQVFQRYVVLRNLLGANFRLIRVRRSFHAFDGLGLERLPFLDQLGNAFRTRFFHC